MGNILRNSSTPFQIHRGTCHGDGSSCDPHEERQTNTTTQSQNRCRSGKDTCTDDTVEDQERRTDDADLSTVVWRRVKNIALVWIETSVPISPLSSEHRAGHTQLGDSVRPPWGFAEGLVLRHGAFLINRLCYRVAHGVARVIMPTSKGLFFWLLEHESSSISMQEQVGTMRSRAVSHGKIWIKT
jgi:hypothetical protein